MKKKYLYVDSKEIPAEIKKKRLVKIESESGKLKVISTYNKKQT